jgi:DNA polymerase I-like protein with 3'-5' exonuclease and polymerase domains
MDEEALMSDAAEAEEEGKRGMQSALGDAGDESDWGVLDDSDMSSAGESGDSSSEEEEGMAGYKHQAAPWRVVRKESSAVMTTAATTTTTTTTANTVKIWPAVVTMIPAPLNHGVQLGRGMSQSQPSKWAEESRPPPPSYYPTTSQCTQTQTDARPSSMYASNQDVAGAALSRPGAPPSAPMTLDIPDEAFLALFDQLEKDNKMKGPPLHPVSEEPESGGYGSDEGAPSPLAPRIDIASSPVESDEIDAARFMPDTAAAFESPYLRPYTPSKRSTPGQFLYLPQTHCSPGTPSAAAVLGKEQASEASRKAFVWKHLAADRNCSEFLGVLKRAKCVSFDLLFAPLPVCGEMAPASVVKAWAPFIAHSPSSSVSSVPANAHQSSKTDPQVLVGISLCFGNECGYYLPLPVPPPLLETPPSTSLEDATSMVRTGHRRTQSRDASISCLPYHVQLLVCRYVGFGCMLSKCPMLRSCLAEVEMSPAAHASKCSNPLLTASKQWAACCRTALRVEWRKGNCVEWRLLGEIMGSRDITKIALDIKLKMICLRERDIHVNGHIEDPNIALALLEATAPLTLPMPTVQSAHSGAKRQLAQITRTCYGSIACFRVMGEMEARLRKQGLWATFANIEMPLIQTVVDAESYGFPIETSFFTNLRQDINDRIKIIEYYFRTHKGPSFNLGSFQDVAALKTQLQQHLTKHSNIKPSEHAQVGLASQQTSFVKTDAGSLWSAGKDKENEVESGWGNCREGLSVDDHPLMLLVKEWRSHTRLIPTLSSVLSSRYRPWGEKLDRVRACFNTIGTETGRLIVTSPPLQQVPHECRYIPPARPTVHEEILQALAISPQTAADVIRGANQKAASGHMEWVRLTPMKSRQQLDQSVSVSMDVSTFSVNGMYQGNGMTISSTFQSVNGKLVRILDSRISDPVKCPDTREVLNLLSLWRDAGFQYSDEEATCVRIVEVMIARKRYFYPADKVCRLLAPVVPDSAESTCVVSSFSASSHSTSMSTSMCVGRNLPAPSLSIVNPRNGFRASRGYVFLTSDYSQIELRILAHFSMDAKLLEAFAQPSDIFSAIAAQWSGKSIESVLKDERDRVKQLCYALLYGAGPAKVAADAGCSVQQAEGLMSNFMGCYPGIQKFMNQVKSRCRAKGCVETLLGRKRHLRDIGSSNRKDRARAERQAVNTVCQGSAADLIKVRRLWIKRSYVS